MAVFFREASSSSPLAALNENNLLQLLSIAVPAVLAIPATAWAGYKLGKKSVEWWEGRRQRLAAAAAGIDPETIPSQAAFHLESFPTAAFRQSAYANVHDDEAAVNAASENRAVDENVQMNYHAGPGAELGNAADRGIRGESAQAEVIQEEANLNHGQPESANGAIGVVDAALSEASAPTEDEGYFSDDADGEGLEITPINNDSTNEPVDAADMFTSGMQTNGDAATNSDT